MNRIVDRESVAMKTFSTEVEDIACDMEPVASHLRQMLYEAEGYMQDESGKRAIWGVNSMRWIADAVAKSADLLEQSDRKVSICKRPSEPGLDSSNLFLASVIQIPFLPQDLCGISCPLVRSYHRVTCPERGYHKSG